MCWLIAAKRIAPSRFAHAYSKHKAAGAGTAWIVKPAACNRGAGIQVTCWCDPCARDDCGSPSLSVVQRPPSNGFKPCSLADSEDPSANKSLSSCLHELQVFNSAEAITAQLAARKPGSSWVVQVGTGVRQGLKSAHATSRATMRAMPPMGSSMLSCICERHRSTLMRLRWYSLAAASLTSGPTS
jgi:hypothetical protein